MWRSPSAHLDHVGLVPHATDLRHVPHLLLDQGGLERYQHEQREDTVVPVLVQAPQPHTEHLQRGGEEAPWITGKACTLNKVLDCKQLFNVK